MKNLPVLLFILLAAACRKEHLTTDPAAMLSTSVDTVRFDTIFTTTRSTTHTFKIFNPNTGRIRIDAIRLMGGSASAFKINVNGTPGPVIENLDIAANDSAYVFVTATIPSTAGNTPFIVQDSLELTYNSNKKKVQLQAYGQNAHFLRNHTITSDETWTAGLPYVVQGKLVIGKNAQLTINEGCTIYAHADGAFIIEGSLQVHGKPWDSTRVIFTGDRLDEPYRSMPGSWPGLYFTSTSHNNYLQHAVLKNAYQAIAIEDASPADTLHLSQTIIDNAFDAGIFASNSQIAAENILISNCGRNLVLQNGGHYTITQATLAAYSTMYLPHKEPMLTVTNGTEAGGRPLNAVFRNCIFWSENSGAVPNEILLAQTGNTAFNVLFDGVLWPPGTDPAPASIAVPPLIADPEFEAIDAANKIYDFHLKETSPARNSGVPAGVSLDLDGRPRPATMPDLGAYQQQ